MQKGKAVHKQDIMYKCRDVVGIYMSEKEYKIGEGGEKVGEWAGVIVIVEGEWILHIDGELVSRF